MSLGPFDLTGGPFLALYAGLLVLTIVAGIVIPHWLRPDGRNGRVTDPEQLAYLAGGKTRFMDAVVSRLLGVGALAFESGKFRIVRTGDGRTPAERNVLAASSPTQWRFLEPALARDADSIRDRLVREELLMDGGTTLQLRFWQVSPYLLLLAFGMIKWEIGTARDRPVGYLTMLLLVTLVLAVIRFATVDRRTRGGQAVVAEVRGRSDRLRRAPTGDEAGLAVALFGTTVLAGSAMAEFHRMRTASSAGDGGSSGGDGGSGCGGGGGGCGGCGS